MKTGTDRKYTLELRDEAVKQVMEGGRGITAVARSLEMSSKTLANRVYRARKGQACLCVGSCGANRTGRLSHWLPGESALALQVLAAV